MRNLVIKSYQIKRELWIWFLMLLVSLGINIYAISNYQTAWNELYLAMHWVLLLSLALYFLLAVLRLVFRFFYILLFR